MKSTQKRTELQLEQWRNKAVADTYEPGSIFKLITTAIALEEDVIDLDWSYTCTGSIKVAGWSKPINCWRRYGHGTQGLPVLCRIRATQLLLRLG